MHGCTEGHGILYCLGFSLMQKFVTRLTAGIFYLFLVVLFVVVFLQCNGLVLQRRRQRWRVLLVFAVNGCAEGMLVDDCSKGSCTCLLLFVVIVFVYLLWGLLIACLCHF